MAKFRKKPVVIEAMRVVGWHGTTYSNQTFEDVLAWCGGGVADFGRAIAIETLEGVMLAHDGDWVIKGIEGEFYPCKNTVFTATYEAVLDKAEVIQAWEDMVE